MTVFILQCKWFDGEIYQHYAEHVFRHKTLAENTRDMLNRNADKAISQTFYIEEVEFNEGAFL